MSSKFKVIASAMLAAAVLAGCGTGSDPDVRSYNRKDVSSAQEPSDEIFDNVSIPDSVEDLTEDVESILDSSITESLPDEDIVSEADNVFDNLISSVTSETKKLEDESKSFDWTVDPVSEIEDISPLFYYQPKTFENSTKPYDYDIASVGTILYDDVAVAKSGGKWALINYKGEYLTNPKYVQIVLGFSGNISAKISNEQYELLTLNSDGTVSASADDYGGTMVIGTNGVTGLVWAENAGQVYQTMDINPYSHTEGTYAAYLGETDEHGIPKINNMQNGNGAKFVLVTDGQRVGSDEFDAAGNYSDGIIPFKKNGKWGYLNSSGETVIPFEYDDACNKKETHEAPMNESAPKSVFNSSNGYVVLCKNNEYAIYTSTGEEIIPFGEYEQLRPVYEGKAWAKKDGKWGVIEVK